MDPTIKLKLHKSFKAQNMMTTLGAEMTQISAGAVTIEAPILSIATQQQGYGHAALAFAIGDSAAGYAALSLMPLEQEVVTTEIKINLLAPSVGQRLIATGRVLKSGKRLSVVSAEVHAEQDGLHKLVAVLQGTMMPVATLGG
ncbi:MAG: PaaI family thioesterase [Pseudomonadota bacterium]